MVLAILLLLVAALCVVAVLREFKAKNFFALGFAGISALVFGWFSIMTIFAHLIGS